MGHQLMSQERLAHMSHVQLELKCVSSHASAVSDFMSVHVFARRLRRLGNHVNGPDVAVFGYLRRYLVLR